jgi:acetyltransferase-like isoleucine patch superfamily enzyme
MHLVAGCHRIDLVGRTIRESGATPRSRIVIQDAVWIGACTSIMKGVTVGQGRVVGAESLVLQDIPTYVIALGNPCKPARKRFSDNELRPHLQILGMAADREEALIQRRIAALDAC